MKQVMTTHGLFFELIYPLYVLFYVEYEWKNRFGKHCKVNAENKTALNIIFSEFSLKANPSELDRNSVYKNISTPCWTRGLTFRF